MNYFTEQIVANWEDSDFAKRHVTIVDEKIDELAKQLAEVKPNIPDWYIPGVSAKDLNARISHLIYATAINFSYKSCEPPFGKFQIGNYSGSTAMGHCFYRELGEEPATADRILDITSTLAKTEDFFRGDVPIPMLQERRYNLHETAYVMKQFGDNVSNLIAHGDWDVIKILHLLIQDFPMAFGRDVTSLENNGKTWFFRFHKRPLLFLLIYQGIATNSGGKLTLLKDPEVIGPVADYAVPNALRYKGVLQYSNGLRHKIDNLLEIPSHSQEDVEIRAGMVTAVCRLLIKINKNLVSRGLKPITMMELDAFLWKLGRKVDTQHHLTRTTDY